MSADPTPETDDLRRELASLPSFGRYGYRADAGAEIVFKRFESLERRLRTAQAELAQERATSSRLREMLAQAHMQPDIQEAALRAVGAVAKEEVAKERERAEKAEAERDAMREDAERMQYSELHSWPGEDGETIYINVPPFPGGTLRDSIDAARKEK